MWNPARDVDEPCLRVAHGAGCVNRTGVRMTTMQPGQAPFGCMWFGAWTANVQVGEDKDQRAIVVYKKGQTGERSFTGLGNSQLHLAGPMRIRGAGSLLCTDTIT